MDFGPYWQESIRQLLQICRLHIHNANLPFHHIPKVLYLIEIWWLWRPFEESELIVIFKKPVWDDLSFVTWCIILLEVAFRRWVHCSHKGMDMVSNNTQVGCGPMCAKKISPTPLHHQPEPLRQGRMDPCFLVLYAKFWPYHLNVGAEIETHQTRQHFSIFYCPILVSLCEL